MEINVPLPDIQESLDEKFFSIGDQGIIFDILRSKMYSNPILAICREISCNARDANREVGNNNVPITIHLPNVNEPYFKVKDSGPGISPDRIENIYIKYGSSTKREDNTQTGGFGLGSKTPFAYTDSFNVNTVFNGIKYNYICFIDDSKVGKISLLSSTETSELNGTEILIPVKQCDFNEFYSATSSSVRYWSVKPIIKGREIIFNTIDYSIIKDDWAFIQEFSYENSIKLIIDEIEYPLYYKDFVDENLQDLRYIRGEIFLFLKNGEINLSANREKVYLDNKTKKVINDKLNKMFSSLEEVFIEKINSFDNLWKARYYFYNINYSFCEKFSHLYWKNIPLKEKNQIRVLLFEKKKLYSRDIIKKYLNYNLNYQLLLVL